MQLKLRHSQREGGLISKTAIFCLDARVQFTPEESASVVRYKLQNQMIYDSEDRQRAAIGGAISAARSRAQGIDFRDTDAFLESATSKIGHGLKAMALGAISAMKLKITISSLERGQHVECKSLDELLGAEEAILEACENLKGYLDTAATFDGRETLIDYTTGQGHIVARAVSPQPQLVAAPLPLAPAPMLQAVPVAIAAPAYDGPAMPVQEVSLPPLPMPEEMLPPLPSYDDPASARQALLGGPESDYADQAEPTGWDALESYEKLGIIVALFVLLVIISIIVK